jgi:hypothetical protein
MKSFKPAFLAFCLLALTLTACTKNNEPVIYSVGVAGDAHVNDYLSLIVHERAPEDLLESQKKTNFSYTDSVMGPVYIFDHVYTGRKWECGEVTYETKLENDTLVVLEYQNTTCEDPQTYFVTTHLTDHRSFGTFELRQLIDGEVVNSEKFDMAEAKEKAKQEAAKAAAEAAATATPEVTPIDQGVESQT